MLQISHKIQIASLYDFEKIINIVKELNIDSPIFIVNHNESYSINFVSNYEQYELTKEIKKAFPEYINTEVIGLGASDIKIIVSRTQNSNSADDWGQSINTDDIQVKLYFVKRDNNFKPEQLPNKTVKVFVGHVEQKDFNINVVDGINPKTKQRGFILLKDKVEDKKDELLINNLFVDETDAFWFGFREITQPIENQYGKYRESQRSKRKSKQSFNDWLKKEVNSTSKKKPSLSNSEKLLLKIGDKIVHDRFRLGIISNLLGDNIQNLKADIDFQDGSKTIMLKDAILNKIE